MLKFLAFVCVLLSSIAHSEQRILYGAIRNGGSGWRLISDTNHVPQNINSVSGSSSGIRITYGFTAKSVGTFLVTADETYARQGITCGASVGLSYSLIQCSDRNGAVDPVDMDNATGNLWVFGVMNQ